MKLHTHTDINSKFVYSWKKPFSFGAFDSSFCEQFSLFTLLHLNFYWDPFLLASFSSSIEQLTILPTSFHAILHFLLLFGNITIGGYCNCYQKFQWFLAASFFAKILFSQVLFMLILEKKIWTSYFSRPFGEPSIGTFFRVTAICRTSLDTLKMSGFILFFVFFGIRMIGSNIFAI